MAGTANQHNELENYLSNLNSNMNSMAERNIAAVSTKILNADNETINARVMQVKVMQPTFGQHKLAMMSAQAHKEASALVQALEAESGVSDVASDTSRSGFEEIALVLEAIEAERTKNNAWINVGGGYFGGSGNLVFYGTNLGYDRLVSIGNNEYLIGAMAGIGGSNYNAGNIKDNSLFYNVGFYVNTDINEVHEI